MKQANLRNTSGDMIVVRFEPESGQYWIDGHPATRQEAVEQGAQVRAFKVRLDAIRANQYHHISLPQLQGLADLPDSPAPATGGPAH
ncbi:MAG TPA: hypothetical protein VER55_11220 [Ardenticatenaceae bacterium]|nr:hypothetical protein [Ardenticatenaceae bacterium]